MALIGEALHSSPAERETDLVAQLSTQLGTLPIPKTLIFLGINVSSETEVYIQDVQCLRPEPPGHLFLSLSPQCPLLSPLLGPVFALHTVSHLPSAGCREGRRE